jgi:hypothetical protein
LTKNQTAKNEIRDHIIETLKNEKPENTKQLVQMIRQRYAVFEEEITSILIQLENENKIHFTQKENPTRATLNPYAFSSKVTWYWTAIGIAIATTIAVFTIAEDTYPMGYIRSTLGMIFVLYLPGYTLMKALFPEKVPIKTSNENLDTIERIALSLGISLAVTPIVGLILNYTPWGITLTPITLSLLALTVVFATAAILREHQASATQPTQKT